MIAIIAALIQVVVLSLVLIGCATGPFSKLSTGASMRVEVEVYKGPLSKHREVQLGEIIGVIREARSSLQTFGTGAYTYSVQLGCLVTNKSDDCKILEGMTQSAKDLLDCTDNLLARAANLDIKAGKLGAHEYGQAEEEARSNELLSYTTDVSALAIQFKAKAFFWAEYQIKTIPGDERVRAKLAEFTTITSEFSNQLASRTTVLYKQFAGKNTKGYNLAVSDHLRDASPTAFLHLFDWYRATYPNSEKRSGLSAADRVRLAQQLFSDHYWTKINEVHASGQGDVSMALIKDDIGNWNLKSFENNPTELLNAYRKLSLAGIQAAVDVAGMIAKGSVPGAGALELAGQFAQGRVGSARIAQASNISMESLHGAAEADLKGLYTRTKVQMEKWIKKVKTAEGPVNEAQKKLDAEQKVYEKADTDVQNQVRKIADSSEEIDSKRSEMEITQTELKTVQENLQNQNLSTSETEALERKEIFLKELNARQTEELKILTANLDTHSRQLKDLIHIKDTADEKLNLAEQTLNQKQAELIEAQRSQHLLAAKIMQEARKIMEIHRRVILALKETQASSSKPKRLREPGLKSSTNIPISADLLKIKH